jgi:hypothetical protein
MKANLFRKISLFFTYKKIIKNIQTELELDFSARIDSIGRIYTVLNIPFEIFEEPYNLRKTDIDTLSKTYINEFRRRFSDFLITKGLMELFDLYEVKKVDKYSYLLVFGFSLVNTKKLANNLITTAVVLSSMGIFGIILWGLISTFF